MVPFTRARAQPSRCSFSASSLWWPLMPRTIGARMSIREPALNCITRSTIWLAAVAVIGTPERSTIVPSFFTFVGAQE